MIYEQESMDLTGPRQRAYLRILEHGLVAIRNFACNGNTAFCRIEADHIHNIPSLLDETNESRHRYYIVGERGLYLDRLREIEATEYLEDRMIWYHESWLVLAAVVGVELCE